ncbi:MAG: 2Fe-2S iron-sulfur cluster-binding protein [Persicimonas sp.]
MSHTATFVTPEGRKVVTEVEEDEYLLFAAIRAGLDLPHTCLQGWCLSCAGRLVEGEVDQSEAFRLYDEDQEAGFVLLCSAMPRSDVRIETCRKKEMQAHRAEAGLPYPRG